VESARLTLPTLSGAAALVDHCCSLDLLTTHSSVAGCTIGIVFQLLVAVGYSHPERIVCGDSVGGAVHLLAQWAETCERSSEAVALNPSRSGALEP